MSEIRNALGGAQFDGFVRVEELPPQGMITLRADLAAPDVAAAVKGVTGAAMPEALGLSRGDKANLCWMSPDEMLVLCPRGAAQDLCQRLQMGLDGVHALAVDTSDARTMFELTGSGLREVIAKLAPIDASPEALPVGRVRRTRLAQVSAALWLEDAGTARVICFRSVARYVFDLLRHSAQPGSEVGYF